MVLHNRAVRRVRACHTYFAMIIPDSSILISQLLWLKLFNLLALPCRAMAVYAFVK
jgi:hypothetical protein